MTATPGGEAPPSGWLARIERVGNTLPDPVFLFLYLVTGLALVSAVAAAVGASATHPTTGERVVAASLLSSANLGRLLQDMPVTFAHFHPLGYVLTVMLGAGVAERTGLFGAAMRRAVRGTPPSALTPAVAFVGMMGNLAADAAFVVFVPLAGGLYAAAGRHPVVGICAAFAAVSGGFSANLFPGQLDALLFGITEAAAETLNPAWDANIAGNWYFIAALLLIDLPVLWFVTDRILEPRLGRWTPEPGSPDATVDHDPERMAAEQRGLLWAGAGAAAVIAVWVALTLAPGAPLLDATAPPNAQLNPLYRSLVAGFLVLFFVSGAAFGYATGAVTDHRDLVRMMTASMAELGGYLVLAFVAAHFVAMFQWSNLGLILAIHGATALAATGLPTPALLSGVVLLTAFVNLFVGSASAKWGLLAPVLVPMLMLLGISPEMTTATYRVGDSATNPVTPLLVYFPLVLVFCQKWEPKYGLGSLLAAMVPYSIGLLLVGLALVVGWSTFDLPLGPNATMTYTP